MTCHFPTKLSGLDGVFCDVKQRPCAYDDAHLVPVNSAGRASAAEIFPTGINSPDLRHVLQAMPPRGYRLRGRVLRATCLAEVRVYELQDTPGAAPVGLMATLAWFWTWPVNGRRIVGAPGPEEIYGLRVEGTVIYKPRDCADVTELVPELAGPTDQPAFFAID